MPEPLSWGGGEAAQAATETLASPFYRYIGSKYKSKGLPASSPFPARGPRPLPGWAQAPLPSFTLGR